MKFLTERLLWDDLLHIGDIPSFHFNHVSFIVLRKLMLGALSEPKSHKTWRLVVSSRVYVLKEM